MVADMGDVDYVQSANQPHKLTFTVPSGDVTIYLPLTVTKKELCFLAKQLAKYAELYTPSAKKTLGAARSRAESLPTENRAGSSTPVVAAPHEQPEASARLSERPDDPAGA